LGPAVTTLFDQGLQSLDTICISHTAEHIQRRDTPMTRGAAPGPRRGNGDPLGLPLLSLQLSAVSFQPHQPRHLRTVLSCPGVLALDSLRCLRSLRLKFPAFSGSPDGLAGSGDGGPQAARHRFRVPPGSAEHKRPPPPIGVPSNYPSASPLRDAAVSGPFPPACYRAASSPGPAVRFIFPHSALQLEVKGPSEGKIAR